MTDEGVEPGPLQPPWVRPLCLLHSLRVLCHRPRAGAVLGSSTPPPRTLGGFACVSVRSGGVDGEGQIHPPWQRARPPLGVQGSPAAGPQRSGCLHARGCGSGSQGPVLKAGFVTEVGVVFWGEHRGPRPPPRTTRGLLVWPPLGHASWARLHLQAGSSGRQDGCGPWRRTHTHYGWRPRSGRAAPRPLREGLAGAFPTPARAPPLLCVGLPRVPPPMDGLPVVVRDGGLPGCLGTSHAST